MQIHKFLPPAAMLIAGKVNAATPTPEVATLYFFSRATLFAESFTEGTNAGKSRQDSIVGAVVQLNAAFKTKVEESELKLLFPWGAMVEKFSGYKPYTMGSYVAVACMSTLTEAIYSRSKKLRFCSKSEVYLMSVKKTVAGKLLGNALKLDFHPCRERNWIR